MRHSKMRSGPATIVVDTHVVLEALLFGDVPAARLVAAIERGDCRWLSSVGMREEFERVASRPRFTRWQPDARALRLAFDRLATLVEPGPCATLRCRDPDDQMFIDLALAHGADWLLTRDRALRELAERAARLGLAIAPPEHFLQAQDTAACAGANRAAPARQ